MIGYLLNIFPDRPKQIFSFSDCQEISFGFVKLMCIILKNPNQKKKTKQLHRIKGANKQEIPKNEI